MVVRSLLSRAFLRSMATAADRPATGAAKILAGSKTISPAGSFRDKFVAAFDKIKKELLADCDAFQFTRESREWVSKMLDYNVPGGKLNRGLSVIDSLVLLKSEDELSRDEIEQAFALGWCIEWLQAYFLVMDDIMDDSHTRRGKPSWFKQPNVGLVAANDALLLRNHVPRILRKYFHGQLYYFDLRELFDEVEYQTACGQMLDLITSPAGKVDLSKYVMETYLRIVKFKTAFYSFYLPVACALYMSGESDNSKFESAKQILLQMGTYFQIQDDFLDCYGHPDVIGKVGTDIQDAKCSWLIVRAIERADASQKTRLENNYGKKDNACVEEVKKVYNDLGLAAAFSEYQQTSYGRILSAIDREKSTRLQGVLSLFLEKIYKRQS
ncbi:farnesyl pyrophosphate synthase [Selaginella moellendorffii]|uniref:farnesyl pyrophosphate synthase n=1 Tax=Selaginella moellendorffii TaxID=88036 RepID=UPI000D1C7FB2|nr:farnesyl pyrophosphate synthase [Selaginella moellendorffii]|eukprot:XP_002987912.2 farnesyl pyrophosphate synthase [Selaginella moellendorffii]